MFIKWKYNDHGHPDFQELEVPTETYNGKTYYGGESSVEDYICELGLVPTWSERFLVGRIKWKRINKPSKEFLKKQIAGWKQDLKWRRAKIQEYALRLEH